MDLIKELQNKIMDHAKDVCKIIAEAAPQHRQTQSIVMKLKAAFPGCSVSPLYTEYSWGDDLIDLTLVEGFNLERDVMTFIDENDEFLKLISGGKEYTIDNSDTHITFEFPQHKMSVYYMGGNCERKKIGEKSKVVKEDIYEIVCS